MFTASSKYYIWATVDTTNEKNLVKDLRCIQTDVARVKATKSDFLSRSTERPMRPCGVI